MHKTILILGASSDIGIAIAKKYSQHGFDIQLAARNVLRLEKTACDLKVRYQVKVSLYEFDMLEFLSHQKFISDLSVLPEVVVSVVGLLGEQEKSERDWEQARLIIDTNYTGPVMILNQFAELFEQRKCGCIIGISSVAGDRGRQSNYMYGAAKAGFTAFLSGLRNRLYKSGVHVLTVKPGYVGTKMTKQLNLPEIMVITPEQVAIDIYKAYKKHKNVIYTAWYWRWIMFIILRINESLFKRLSL